MNNKDFIAELVSISNDLDKRGLSNLADVLDNIIKMSMPLSRKEEEQLGNPHPSSSFKYISRDDWNRLREKLVSKKPSRSYVETDDFKYDPELTAYTPGEALDLLSNPKIQNWFRKIEEFIIPEEHKHVILVPCAASKPWGVSCPSSGKYYKAYHDIKESLQEESEKPYWVTISEPLGIVPEDMWDSFPGYDVPGLFKDPSSRMSGMTTKQWKGMFGEKYSPPFDQEAYDEAIKKLGEVIFNFIKNNNIEGRRWISFVKGTKGKVTTHTDMINEARAFLDAEGISWDHTEYQKDKDEPGHPTRDRIREHMLGIIQSEISKEEPLIGYKVVSRKDGKLYSIMNPEVEYKAGIGSVESSDKGIFLGNSRDFADYYTGLTDEEDVLLVYEYNEEDILSGNPNDHESEVLVERAVLKEVVPIS